MRRRRGTDRRQPSHELVAAPAGLLAVVLLPAGVLRPRWAAAVRRRTRARAISPRSSACNSEGECWHAWVCGQWACVRMCTCRVRVPVCQCAWAGVHVPAWPYVDPHLLGVARSRGRAPHRRHPGHRHGELVAGAAYSRRRRDCHFADVPSTPLLKRLREEEGGCSRNDSRPPTAGAASTEPFRRPGGSCRAAAARGWRLRHRRRSPLPRRVVIPPAAQPLQAPHVANYSPQLSTAVTSTRQSRRASCHAIQDIRRPLTCERQAGRRRAA